MSAASHLAVFDVDGTLIDSQDVIVAAAEAAFRSENREPPPRAEILSIVGLSLPLAIETLVPGSDSATVARMTAAYRDSFVRLRATTGGERTAPLFPGARAALETLHAIPGLALGIATGKARRGLQHTFDGHGLEHYFQTAQTADDHPSKPDPSMLNRAGAEVGVPAARALMIGDTEFDIAMGRAAGFATIAVTWGYHPVERLQAAGADYLIDGFGDLPGIVLGHWGIG